MSISRRNWITAFAIAVLVHAGIILGWLFLSINSKTQAAEEEVVRVSLGKWVHMLTVDSRGTATAPEVPVAQEVSSSAVSSVSTESPVSSEVVRDVHVRQIRKATIGEAVNAPPNMVMLSRHVELEESTGTSNLADSLFDVATAVNLASSEELPANAEPAEPEQIKIEQVESTRVNILKKDVPSATKAQDALSEEAVLERTPDQPVPDHSAKQQDSGNDSALPQQEAIGQKLTRLPQDEINPAIHAEADSRLLQEYLKVVMSRLNAQKRYPRAARRRGATGVARVRFTILADGSMESSELVESSGNRHLDKESLGMLSRAEPFPPIPKSLQQNRVELQIPVVFTLN